MKLEEVIGSNVKTARREAGLTGEKLGAELAKWLGKEPWPRSTVAMAERGDRRFAAAELVALSLVLDKPVTWFFIAEPGDEIEMPSGERLPGREVADAAYRRVGDLAEVTLEIRGHVALGAHDARVQLREANAALRKANAALNAADRRLAAVEEPALDLVEDRVRQQIGRRENQ